MTIATKSQAQVDSLGNLTRGFARYINQGPIEKLFLHIDRPLYLSGETMWFKIYAIDGTTARPLSLSSVAYVEILDSRSQPVLQSKIALAAAQGAGFFTLPAALASGNYTVRAYTSWMRNASPDTYFSSSVTILNTSTASGQATAANPIPAIDVQFFPEGGHMVHGLPGKVGVKITDQTGKGIRTHGIILDRKGQTVARFSVPPLGMGNFTFTPSVEAAPYTAVTELGTGRQIRHLLPLVQSQGYAIGVQEADLGKLQLTVRATTRQPETIYLLGHSQQKIAVASQAQLVNGQATFSIRKADLLDGISHFTLFNANQQPVCERLYFKRPTNRLQITASLDKVAYTTRDQVTVRMSTAQLPLPEAASLSMAVYRLDSLNTVPLTAIDRYFWLTSDLRGQIENPDFYFLAPDSVAAEAADNLMLTQGWSRFRWDSVLTAQPRSFRYAAEPFGHVIRGQLSQAATIQPRAGIITYLSSPSRLVQLTNTQSSKTGQLQFEMLRFYGSRELILQTNPKQDSTSRITLLNPFSQEYSSNQPVSFSLAAQYASEYARRHFQQQVQTLYATDSPRYVQPATDSTAFYGQTSETYLLDKYTRFKVLEEVLREYVPSVIVRIRKDGFHLLVVDRVNKAVLQENPLVLLDGVPVFNINKIMAINPLKIQRLDVVTSRYIQGAAIYDGIVSFTTYKGDLEEFQLDTRVLIQQYEGLQQRREFYAPRYATTQEKQSRLPDLRNLLYWNPAVSTTGTTPTEATFYTGDQPGRYLLLLQGISSTGAMGSTRVVLEVKPAL